uniref:Uncharacterized protein n=1 Tax=Myoviridae sp. ctisV53 TaxID=2825156 RepID=A0A8S5PMB1_9CAUD|nr:MAG TPA: hypothetical protein [Myoviridae sp. ctisV53]DAE49479.1 MAG TPA: hypothetical protein [Bacteriophage sp.]
MRNAKVSARDAGATYAILSRERMRKILRGEGQTWMHGRECT